MAMVYKFSIHNNETGEKLGSLDYDTREEAEEAFSKLSKTEQKKYQVIELGYQNGQ